MSFCLDEWRHTGAEVDGGAWTSLCGSGIGSSPAGAVSHESRLPHLFASLTCLLEHSSLRLAGSVEVAAARQLGGGGHGKRVGRGEEAARWRRTSKLGPVGNAVRMRQLVGACRGWGRGAALRGPAAARWSVMGRWAWQHRKKTVQQASGHADETSK
jgi:hypothetical protein